MSVKTTITILALVSIATISCVHGQDNTELFTRLQGIANNGMTFYNIDGIEIMSQEVTAEFTAKNISKKFKQSPIRKQSPILEKELTTSDSSLSFKNFYVFKSTEVQKGLSNNISYYFIEGTDQKIISITFAAVNKTDKTLERRFVKLIREKAIPDSIFTSLKIDSVNFAGRRIHLGQSCRWMGVNNVQCPYYGQMNWSIHKSIEDASQTVENEFKRIKSQKGGKVVSDTIVPVIFEGTETLAKRIIYDITGINSALVGMSGGKTLTVYLVAVPVRGNFVSCIMSFWNNDQINPSGLPPLLEEVMRLK